VTGALYMSCHKTPHVLYFVIVQFCHRQTDMVFLEHFLWSFLDLRLLKLGIETYEIRK